MRQQKAAATVFSQQCAPVAPQAALTHSSSSPGFAHRQARKAFSDFPMTDFRQMGALRAYGGGTARDFHPFLYSPRFPYDKRGT